MEKNINYYTLTSLKLQIKLSLILNVIFGYINWFHFLICLMLYDERQSHLLLTCKSWSAIVNPFNILDYSYLTGQWPLRLFIPTVSTCCIDMRIHYHSQDLNFYSIINWLNDIFKIKFQTFWRLELLCWVTWLSSQLSFAGQIKLQPRILYNHDLFSSHCDSSTASIYLQSDNDKECFNHSWPSQLWQKILMESFVQIYHNGEVEWRHLQKMWFEPLLRVVVNVALDIDILTINTT